MLTPKLIKIYSKIKKEINSSNSNNENNFEEIVDEYDLIIIGGGNMLMTLTNRMEGIVNFNRYVMKALENNKPIFLMDIGIGPFYNEKHTKYAVESLNRAEEITFRDKQSYNYFVENGGDKKIASVSVDTAFLYRYHLAKEKKNSEQKVVAVNIMDSRAMHRNIPKYKTDINSYVKLINTLLVDSEMKIILFATSKEDQAALDDVYARNISNDQVVKKDVNGLSDIQNIYDESDLLIGTRMHSMIIGFTKYLPVIGLTWQPKIDALFELLDQENYLIKFNQFENSIELINELVHEKLVHLDLEKIEIEKKLNEVRQKSNRNNEILLYYKNVLKI